MMNTVKKNIKVIALLVFFILVFFSFPYLCSAQEEDELHHHDHGDHHHHIEEPPSFKYSREANVKTASEQRRPKKQMSLSSLWLEALSSTLIISIAPFFILFFVPLNSKRDHEDVLKLLLSFASGGLLGDAFLHLIPHALQPHSHIPSDNHHHEHSDEHSHSHETTNIGMWVLCGILAFFIVDKCVRLIKGEHSHTHLADSPEKKDEKSNEKSDENDNSDAMSESEDEIQIAGYLNLIADFIHNLTDGLAIGASYLAGETVGLVTTITILFHEIPHEIGDFAILVQSGYSKKKAMLLQLITACGALTGTLVALVSGGVDVTTSWVLPFTAGGFIYISTVSIIPELLRDTTFVQSLKEIFALLFGVLMMVIVAQFE